MKGNFISKLITCLKRYSVDFVFLSLSILVISIYVLGQTDLKLIGALGYAVATPSATIAFIASFYLLRSSWKGGLRPVFLGFFLGSMLWFIGEIGWDFYTTFFAVEVPYPSWADVSWILGYFFMGYAMIVLLKRTRFAITRFMKTVWALFGFVIFSITGYLLLFPLLSRDVEFLTLFFDLAYPILDSALLFLAVEVLIVLWRSGYGVAWLPIPIFILMNGIADISFTYLTLQDAYFQGHPVDALFSLAYLIFAFGNYKIWSQVQAFQRFFATPSSETPSYPSNRFSESVGLTPEELSDKRFLLEFDPASKYEEAVKDFTNEASSREGLVVVFTRRGSSVYSALSKRRGLKFFSMSSEATASVNVSENELLIPANNTSLLLFTLREVMDNDPAKQVWLIFDNLSELILDFGFEKTYKFTQYATEFLSTHKATALFLLNPSAHDSEIVSRFRGIFSDQVTYDKNRVRPIKLQVS